MPPLNLSALSASCLSLNFLTFLASFSILLQLPQLTPGKMKITTLLVAAAFAVEYAVASPARGEKGGTSMARFKCVTNIAKTKEACKEDDVTPAGYYDDANSVYWCFMFKRESVGAFTRHCGGWNNVNCRPAEDPPTPKEFSRRLA
ncbi:hypothetical protein LZ30DRAFT_810210 [Colletotrichum cereale]|nr:hypothetical protein LZ30DRAFT_810210 [Colletotrichum cereale]